MAVRPKPYKLVCANCGYSKIVAPKSDCLTGEDLLAMNPVCKKCGNILLLYLQSFETDSYCS